MRRDVGAAAQAKVVPREEHAVAAHRQIGFEHVGALRRGQRVTVERVLGPIAAGAAMGDHARRGAVQRIPFCRHQ
jgi:hypothetical protein